MDSFIHVGPQVKRTRLTVFFSSWHIVLSPGKATYLLIYLLIPFICFSLLFLSPLILTITMFRLTDNFPQNLYVSEIEQDIGTQKRQMSKACILGILEISLRKLN